MSQEKRGPRYNSADTSQGDIIIPNKPEDVVEKESRDVVLEFMVKHQIPLRPKEVYGGLIYNYDITFSHRHVQDVLREFDDKGLVKRVEIDAGKGEVLEIPDDGSDRRAYYLVTEMGIRETRK